MKPSEWWFKMTATLVVLSVALWLGGGILGDPRFRIIVTGLLGTAGVALTIGVICAIWDK